MQADAFLTRLRQDRQSRKTWLLDITTEVGAPCAVAISCAPGGGTFAFGAAARMTMDAAVKAALLEACQLELAYEIVEAKIRERGEAALNAFDRAHLLRASAVNAETCALLQPMHDGEPPMRGAPPQSLPDLIAKVAHCGIEVHFLDITRRSWGIPAARLVAPALQLEPSDLVSDRLADVVAKTGGGGKFTGGIPLL
jgi:ribosomal protein S12 methylthiotransferase accessory factor